jgi:hypothetical protein
MCTVTNRLTTGRLTKQTYRKLRPMVRASIKLAAARSNVWVYGHSLAGVSGSNPAGGMEVCLL